MPFIGVWVKIYLLVWITVSSGRIGVGYETSWFPTIGTTNNPLVKDWINKTFQPNNTPTMEIIDYFDTCPLSEKNFNSVCRGPFHSCTNRCGEFMGKIKDTFSMDQCSCDVFCVTMGECCWDFADKCPVEANRQKKEFSYLSIDNVTCDGDIVVIEGPGDNSNGLSVDEDFLVTDGKTGLTFRNVNVYKYHFNKNFDGKSTDDGKYSGGKNDTDPVYDDHLHFWTKKFMTLYSFLSLNDVRGVISDEKSIGDSMLQDEPPEMVKLRLCKNRVLLHCWNDHGGSKCSDPKTIQTDSLGFVCVHAIDLQNVSMTAVSTSTPRITSKKIRDPNIDHTYGNGKCMLSWETYHPTRYKTYRLNIGLTVNKAKRTVEVSDIAMTSDIQAFWKNVQCSRQTKGNCDLVVLCGRGYIFVDSKCRRPSKLAIDVIGKEDNPGTITKVMNGVTNAITQNLTEGLNISNNPTSIKTYYDCTGIVRLSYEMELTKYDIEADGTSLPITSPVIKYLSMSFSQDFNIHQVVICFVVEDEMGSSLNAGPIISCDSLLYTNNFAPEHCEHDILQCLQKSREQLEPYTNNQNPHMSTSDKLHIHLILVLPIISRKPTCVLVT